MASPLAPRSSPAAAARRPVGGRDSHHFLRVTVKKRFKRRRPVVRRVVRRERSAPGAWSAGATIFRRDEGVEARPPPPPGRKECRVGRTEFIPFYRRVPYRADLGGSG